MATTMKVGFLNQSFNTMLPESWLSLYSDDQSQDGSQNYFRDQQDDFHSDDAYEDEFEISQNTLHNVGGQVGIATPGDDPRGEWDNNFSAQGDGDATCKWSKINFSWLL
jgi:hypothetical protein